MSSCPLSPIFFAALLGAAVLPPTPSHAERRVVAPPGAKPVEPSPTAAAEPPKKGEPKPELPAAPAKAAPTPSPGPADAGPAAPEPPTVVVPKDELMAVQTKADAGATLVTPTEVQKAVYRKKIGKWAVALHVRPDAPRPGRPVTLALEVARILDIPDPAIGDRAPEEGASFDATIARDAKGAVATRHRLIPMRDPGTYGMRFTPPQEGLYKIDFEQRLGDKAEVGESALAAPFTIGVGIASPMKVSAADDAGGRGKKGRAVLKSGPDGARPEGPQDAMRALGTAWVQLHADLAAPKPPPADLAEAARAIRDASGKVAGQVPASLAAHGKEFDQLAARLGEAVKDLPSAVAGDRAKARGLLEKVEADLCNRCHVKFRFRLAEDVGEWPAFEPRETKGRDARR